MKPLSILVIDDEAVICRACKLILAEQGFTVDSHMSGIAGLNAISQNRYDIVLLDLKLPDMDGLDVMKLVKKEKPDTRVIVMTGYSTIAIAVAAMKFGAADYLSKPFTDDELITVVEKARKK
jgi:DNA-binding NtrC family response regulator